MTAVGVGLLFDVPDEAVTVGVTLMDTLLFGKVGEQACINRNVVMINTVKRLK